MDIDGSETLAKVAREINAGGADRVADRRFTSWCGVVSGESNPLDSVEREGFFWGRLSLISYIKLKGLS